MSSLGRKATNARQFDRRADSGVAAAPRAMPPTAWMLPDPEGADADGVVGVGADLAPETLVDAYRRGIFPWPHEQVPLPWFSPDPRGVIRPEHFHASRSLRRRLRQSGWHTTVDVAFNRVVAACAAVRDDGTWITNDMAAAYGRLHEFGWAHSLEVWDEGTLVGGVYGVQVGGVFTGESMFHRATDASKVALADLCHRFAAAGGTLLDVQLMTDHLQSMGARALRRQHFLATLAQVRDDDVRLEVGVKPVSRLTNASEEPGAASVGHTGIWPQATRR